MADRTCSIEGCMRGGPITRTWCSLHYQRWWFHGDPRPDVPALADVTVTDRFWPKVDTTGPDGCWLWLGSMNPAGYGQVKVNGKCCLTHRVAYELLVGSIPDGLELDHLCRVRRCVNPRHLEPVTHAENLRRTRKDLTHCKQGHPYDEANTYIRPSGYRNCRRCHADRSARSQLRSAS